MSELVMSHSHELYQRYVAAYNRIEQFLAAELKQTASFRKLVEQYWTERPWLGDRSTLHVLADLRNVIVHRQTDPHKPLFHPSEDAVRELEAIRDRLLTPRRFLDEFPRQVTTVSPGDTLAHVLVLVRKNDFSQFPVYDGTSFRGLLTENGITRWVANQVGCGNPPRFEAVVADLLERQEKWNAADAPKWPNCAFVPATSSVEEVLGRFFINPSLEAVLLTESGGADGPPQGIATQWDALESRS